MTRPVPDTGEGQAGLRITAGVEAFDRWVEEARTRKDRDAFVGLMLREGRTLQEIANVLGVTRERVRQLAQREGETTRSRDLKQIDIVRIVTAIRNPATHGMEELSAATGYPRERITEALRALGLHAATLRLWRWRCTAPGRRQWAAKICDEASRLGRTPTLKEISAVFGWGPTQAGPALASRFGSTSSAMRYCGLTPRSAGGRGHVTPGGGAPRQSHCNRGHEFTPENTYVHKTGRQCIACRRLREVGKYKRTNASRLNPKTRSAEEAAVPAPSTPTSPNHDT